MQQPGLELVAMITGQTKRQVVEVALRELARLLQCHAGRFEDLQKREFS